jgi:uncharacterized protein YndB with AHSA1/START domain
VLGATGYQEPAAGDNHSGRRPARFAVEEHGHRRTVGVAAVDAAVLVWGPPHRLVFTWQINGSWQFDPDPEHASEIEVVFTEDGPGQTTVAVEHRHLDRLDGGQGIYDAIRGGGGCALLHR